MKSTEAVWACLSARRLSLIIPGGSRPRTGRREAPPSGSSSLSWSRIRPPMKRIPFRRLRMPLLLSLDDSFSPDPMKLSGSKQKSENLNFF